MTVETHAPRTTVADVIRQHRGLIAESLPRGIDPDRFTRLALTTLRKTPQLQQCDPQSFVGALLTASALGLEPDVNGECYLVPYKRECTLIVGYQGLSKLYWQHPLAARLSAEYVCANDEFDYDKGLTPRLHHKPAVGDRGDVIAFYAIVGLKNGATWFDVFSVAQIAKLRGTTKKGSVADPEHWMSRKTALKQVLKLAPKATEMQQLYAVDERAGSLTVARQIAAHEVPAIEAVPDGVNPETGEVHTAELADGQMFPEGGAS